MDRKIVEVGFGLQYVYKPQNRNRANTIQAPRDVDDMEATPYGILAQKEVDGIRYTSLWPWGMVADVKFEKEDLRPAKAEEPAADKKDPDLTFNDEKA